MIHHVALEVRPADADACVRFWALLGFAEVAAPSALAGRSRWLQRGEQQIHLLLAEDAVAPTAGHVALEAADYDLTLGRLRHAGFAPDPREEHWGSPRAFVRTPSGHRVELMAQRP